LLLIDKHLKCADFKNKKLEKHAKLIRGAIKSLLS